MTVPQHLENAPIQEALIDIRVSLADDFHLDLLREVGEQVKGFSQVREAKKLEAHLEIERPTVRSSVTARGLHFVSDDDRRVAQLRTDGFTFNWLKPYSTWDDLSEQAREFWRHFVRIAAPEEISRVAVRYINRFPVMLPINMEHVFAISLDLPPGITGDVSDFLYRVSFRETEYGQRCNLTLTGERKPTPQEADIIFDIDCYDVRRFHISDDVVWEEVLPRLRHLKNRVFFSGLTEEWIERFR